VGEPSRHAQLGWTVHDDPGARVLPRASAHPRPDLRLDRTLLLLLKPLALGRVHRATEGGGVVRPLAKWAARRPVGARAHLQEAL